MVTPSTRKSPATIFVCCAMLIAPALRTCVDERPPEASGRGEDWSEYLPCMTETTPECRSTSELSLLSGPRSLRPLVGAIVSIDLRVRGVDWHTSRPQAQRQRKPRSNSRSLCSASEAFQSGWLWRERISTRISVNMRAGFAFPGERV